MKEQFTLHLDVGDEQDSALGDLVTAAKKIQKNLGIEAVEFDYMGATYTITRNSIVRSVDWVQQDYLTENNLFPLFNSPEEKAPEPPMSSLTCSCEGCCS